MRLVLYGTLVAVGLVVWSMRPAQRVVLGGETGQGEPFTLQARDDGEVDAFDTHLVAACGEDRTIQIRWFPNDGDPVAFERDGARIEVREDWSREGEPPTVCRAQRVRRTARAG